MVHETGPSAGATSSPVSTARPSRWGTVAAWKPSRSAVDVAAPAARWASVAAWSRAGSNSEVADAARWLVQRTRCAASMAASRLSGSAKSP